MATKTTTNAETNAESEALLKENEELAKRLEEAEKRAAKAEVEAKEANKKLEEKIETGAAMNLTPVATKMEKIMLFKDGKEYKDDLTVGVNGVFYKIKRGVEVEVPDFVAEVIRNSQKQDAATNEMIAQEVENAKKASEKLD